MDTKIKTNRNKSKNKKQWCMITSVESDIVVLSQLHSFCARTLPLASLASLASWHLANEDAMKSLPSSSLQHHVHMSSITESTVVIIAKIWFQG